MLPLSMLRIIHLLQNVTAMAMTIKAPLPLQLTPLPPIRDILLGNVPHPDHHRLKDVNFMDQIPPILPRSAVGSPRIALPNLLPATYLQGILSHLDIIHILDHLHLTKGLHNSN